MINARDLHGFLQVGRDFSNWIKDRSEKYGFIEDEDFFKHENLSSPNLGSSKARRQKSAEEFSPNFGKNKNADFSPNLAKTLADGQIQESCSPNLVSKIYNGK